MLSYPQISFGTAVKIPEDCFEAAGALAVIELRGILEIVV